MTKRTLWLLSALLMCLGGIMSNADAATTKVYQQTTNGNTDIYGWDSSKITDNPGYDGQPAVSPDGTAIAFTSNRGGGNRLFTMALDGSNVSQITTHDSGYPAWSPDGTKIAYASNGYLRVVDLSSNTSRQVGNSWSVSRPSWSPDGATITYAFYAGGNSDIYSVSASADAQTSGQRLTTESAYDQSPSWTATSRIVFQSNRFGATDNLFVMNSDGGGVKQLTNYGTGTRAYLPTVSNGNLIYFTSNERVGQETDLHRPYVMTTEGSGRQRVRQEPAEFVGVQAINKPATQLVYVALGDSVAAGEGINEGWAWSNGGWSGGSDDAAWEIDRLSPNGQLCHQSSSSYKYLVKSSLEITYSSFHDYSCSGASVPNGLLRPQQFRNKSQATSSQIEAMYSNNAPDVVTMTVGANDIGFSDFLWRCYKPLSGRCDTFNNTISQLVRLASQRKNLDLAIKQILNRGQLAGKVPKIYLTGYFDPFSDDMPTCQDTRLVATASLTPAERSWLKKGLSLLNRNIRSVAARHSSVTYVDISSVMSGHGFCSSDPWVFGPSILLQNPGVGAPYHPTAAGQAAIALRVIEALA